MNRIPLLDAALSVTFGRSFEHIGYGRSESTTPYLKMDVYGDVRDRVSFVRLRYAGQDEWMLLDLS
jgi:hypothetical protein